MANDLTAEQLAQIMASIYAPTGGGEAGTSQSAPRQALVGDYNYAPQFDAYGNMTGLRSFQNDANANNTPAMYNGREYTGYDLGGHQNGTGTLSGFKNGGFEDWLPFILAGAGLGAGTLAATGASGAGAAGAANGSWDVLPAASGGGVGSGAAGGMGAAAGGLETMAPMSTSGLTYGGAGLPAAMSGGGSAGLLGGLGSYLGPAASLLGAVAGSKGVNKSENVTKSMDPRMDAAFYGDVLPRIQGLLAQQMTPQAMQGYTDMQSVGRGLLATPQLGNGFARFFPGR